MMVDIRHIPIFEDLSDDTLESIAPLCEACTCHEGVVFEQGAPAVHIYILVEGSIDILYKPYDAPPITITNIKPGEIFGWSAIANNNIYTSGAACRGESQTIRIDGKALRALCIDNPNTGEIILDRLAESVSKRWHNAHAQVRDILSHGISNHLYR